MCIRDRDSVDHPVSLYAASKKSNELMAHTYSHLFGLPTTGLRFFTVYGPWGRPDMALFLFTKKILVGEPVSYTHLDVYKRQALINELALIFHRLGIDTHEVLAASGTKWNFLPFKPGLVGGHCIGVDPYYLTHKAQQIGYHPDVILAGRRINDGMGPHLSLIHI